MYTSQYYTNPEIDERLLQGYYDDAVAAGFTGSKADFHQAIIKARNLSEGVSDIDSLHSVTDFGTYLYTGHGWKGLVNVNFDASSNVSQVALSSSTPSYENDSLTWLSGKPCVMVRTYTNGAWSAWRKAGADVVNDLVTGGTDKALSAEQGKVLDEKVADLGPKIGEVVEFKPEIERGMLSNSGNNSASNTQLRTVGYIESPKIRVEIQTGKYRIYGYDANGFVLVEDGWRTASATIAKEGCTRYRLCFGKVGEPTITVAEYADLGIHIYDAEDRRTVALRSDIEDSLESNDPTKILSAKQGKILAEGLQTATTTANGAAADVDLLKTDLHGEDADLLNGLTTASGKYYSTSAGYITLADNASSEYYPQIDISQYVGKSIKLANNITTAGIRLFAITRESGSILKSYTETNFRDNNGQFVIEIPLYAKYLYVSYKPGSVVSALVMEATPGNYYTKAQVNALVGGNSSEVIYVSTSGNDSNDGTMASPLATIQEAVKRSSRVKVLGGTYQQGLIDMSLCAGNEVTISSAQGSRVILFGGDKIAESDGTAHGTYSGVKVLSLTGYTDNKNWIYQYGVVDSTTLIAATELTPYHKRRSHRCEHTALVRVSSVQAVSDSVVPAFYFDGGTLYYKTPSAVSSTNFLFVPTTNLFSNTTDKKITLIGIDVVGRCINLVGTVNSLLSDCSAGYTKGSGAIILDDSQECRVVRCEACRCEAGVGVTTGDGINVHSTGVTSAKILNVFTTFELIDCWSHDNYNDGYSDHEGCIGSIKGGLYEYNCLGGHGAGLTPALGATDTIVGVIAQGNKYDGIQYHSNGTDQSGADYGTLYCEGCVSRYNTRDGFRVTQSSNSGDFVNCIAYGNGEKGFNNYSSSYMRLINCKAGSNEGTDITSGCVKILCD